MALSAAEKSRRVPDRRGISAFGGRHPHLRRHFDTEVFCVIGRPARRRNFDHAHIVEGAQRRIEVGILPDRDHFARADRIGPCCVGDIDRVADGCPAAAVGIDCAASGDRDVVNALLGLAGRRIFFGSGR